jgi:microcystin-dependent protein
MARTRFTVKEGLSVADDNAVGGYPLIPVGALMPYAGATAPDGWLLCNGQTPSRTTYANLFAVIGTTYGAGDGSTFGLPDPMGRAIIGVGSGSGLTARALAAKSGAETVVIASGNLPTHEHTLSAHTHTLGNHTHALGNHTHALGSHTHSLQSHTHGITVVGNNFNTSGHSVDHSHIGPSHAHNIPRSLIATAGTNRAVVSSTSNQPTLNVDAGGQSSSGGASVDHSHNANHGHTASSGGPSNNTSGGPSADSGGPSADSGGPSAGSGGPSTANTGNGGFANTALAMMNPFLALNYIIKY